jgi:hypothetical protein
VTPSASAPTVVDGARRVRSPRRRTRPGSVAATPPTKPRPDVKHQLGLDTGIRHSGTRGDGTRGTLETLHPGATRGRRLDRLGVGVQPTDPTNAGIARLALGSAFSAEAVGDERRESLPTWLSPADAERMPGWVRVQAALSRRSMQRRPYCAAGLLCRRQDRHRRIRVGTGTLSDHPTAGVARMPRLAQPATDGARRRVGLVSQNAVRSLARPARESDTGPTMPSSCVALPFARVPQLSGGSRHVLR